MKKNLKSMIALLLILMMFMTLVGCGNSTDAEDTTNELNPTEEQDVEEAEEIEGDKDEEEVVEIVEAFPGAEYTEIDDEQLSSMKEAVRTLQSIEEANIDGEMVGYRILIAPNGYGGPMQVFTYIDLDGKVLQVEIGEQGETEGIGDSVKNPKFLSGFNNVTSIESIKAVDGVAGATFSSGAVKDGITRALNIFADFLQ